METKPQLIIFAGPNGSGKTTFYEGALQLFQPNTPNLQVVNPDLIAKQLANDQGFNNVNELPPKLKSQVDIQAAKIALKERKRLIQSQASFIIETTASSKSLLDVIAQAQSSGYIVHTYFFMPQTPELNNYRVAARTKKGVHFVEPDIVERRYLRAKELLVDICMRSDRFTLFDSGTDKIIKLLFKRQGQVFICAGHQQNNQILDFLATQLLAKGLTLNQTDLQA